MKLYIIIRGLAPERDETPSLTNIAAVPAENRVAFSRRWETLDDLIPL